MRSSPPFRRGAPRSRPLAPSAALLVAALAACGDGSTESGPPPLARLAIDQAALDTLSELATRQLTVTGFDRQGATRAVEGVVWTSSDTAVATVAPNGTVTARRPGASTLTARSGDVTASLALRVVEVPIWDIAVRFVGGVSGDTLLVGQTASVVAEPRDLAGRALVGRRVTLAVADDAPATLDAEGRVTGRAVGFLEVRARVDSVERTQRLVVRPAFAAALGVRMADPRQLRDTLWVGLADSVVVAFTDSAGRPLAPTPFRPVSFSSDDPTVAGIDTEGRVRPAAPGRVTLRAAGDRLVAAKTLVVVRAPVMTMTAAPDTVRVVPGGVTQLRPVLVDGAGLRVTALNGRPLAFASDAPAIATVDAAGVVRGVSPGETTLRLTSERGTTTVPVRVVEPAGDRAFRITVRYVGPTPAPEVVAAFDAAKARWERVIRETIGTVAFTLDSARCGSTDPTHTETITDVLIFARIDTIDGPSNVLGQAGPCITRRMPSGRFLPVIGRMAFDSADMRTMITSGRLPNVIAHEMGHVLGIGTLWTAFDGGGVALAVQRGTADPRYVGVGGMLASAGMGFTSVTVGETGSTLLERVPLENTGGAGTAGSHWRRSVFGNELMNGFAGIGESPLSLLTVQAMADLGYAVATSGAELWGQLLVGNPTSASAAIGALLGPGMAIREVLTGPEWHVDAGGRVRPLPSPGRGPAAPR